MRYLTLFLVVLGCLSLRADVFLPGNVTTNVALGQTLTFDQTIRGEIQCLTGAGDVVFAAPSEVTICAAEAFTGTVTLNGGTLVAPKSLEDRVTVNSGNASFKTFDEMAAQTLTFTVAGYTGESTLEMFPVLLRLPPGSISPLLLGSDDARRLRAAAGDSDTECPYEVETWNPDGESLLWVRLPTVTKAGTTFRLLVGAGVSSFAASETWKRTDKKPAEDGSVDTENFGGVWHMASPSTTDVPDATGNGLTAVPYRDSSTPGYTNSVAVSGPVGTARRICGSDCTDSCAAKLGVEPIKYNALQLGTKFTISFWARCNSNWNASKYPRFISTKYSWTSSGYGWEVSARANATTFDVKGGTGAWTTPAINEAVWNRSANDTWDQFTVVFDGSSALLYTNGAYFATGTCGAPVHPIETPLWIGGQNQDASFRGEMDEVRLLDCVASADWIAADHATQARVDFLSADGATTRGGVFSVEQTDLSHTANNALRLRVGAIGAGGASPTVTVTVYDASGTAVACATKTFAEGQTYENFQFDSLMPETSYSVVASSDLGAGSSLATAAVRTERVEYKLLSGDTYVDNLNIGGNSSMMTYQSAEYDRYVHSNNWQNVYDESDVLPRLLQGADFGNNYLVDATEKDDPTAGGRWILCSTALSLKNAAFKETFPGQRLTIRGDRLENLTYVRGGGLSVRGHDPICRTTIPELVLENATVWHGTPKITAGAWYTELESRIVIPAGKFGFFETSYTGVTDHRLDLFGSLEGAGTAVFCNYYGGESARATYDARGFRFANDWSQLTGKVQFQASRNCIFDVGFVPPADCPTLTTDGILLDNLMHTITSSQHTSVNSGIHANKLTFKVDATFATPNRGITIADGGGEVNEWQFNVEANKTVTLQNPFYGSGLCGKMGEGTLRLCGMQGDYSGTFTASAGTLVFAGQKPIGDGTLDVSNAVKLELDAAALAGGACRLKAVSGAATIVVTSVPDDFGAETAILTTSAQGGVAEGAVTLDASLKNPLTVRSAVSGGERTFFLCRAPGNVRVSPGEVFGGSVRATADVVCPAGQTFTATAQLKDANDETVATLTKTLKGPDGTWAFELFGDAIRPNTAYTLIVSVAGDTLLEPVMVSMPVTTTTTLYKMQRGDTSAASITADPSGNSSMSSEAIELINTYNWQNVDDATDILERISYKTEGFEFLIDATEKDDPSGGVWNLRSHAYSASGKTTELTFNGRRLTIVGDRKADLTYVRGGGVSLRGHDTFVNFKELVLKNGSVWVDTRDAWHVYFNARRLIVPGGYRGFVETWRTDPTVLGGNYRCRDLNLSGSIEGAGTLVFCQAGDHDNMYDRGFVFKNNWSALTGKIEFNRSTSYAFTSGFVPPADCPELTEDGILLDNKYHNVTESLRSERATVLTFNLTTTFATPNRGITVADGAECLFNVCTNKTVTLRNPFYGSGALGMGFVKWSTRYDYPCGGTLRLEGTQGDWSGTFAATNGTLVLAGSKPLGEGTLFAGDAGKVELDVAALNGVPCYLKAAQEGTQIDVKRLPALSPEMEDLAILSTPAEGGVMRNQLVLPALPDGVSLRSVAVGGVRTFSVGKKAGIVVIVR